MTDALLHAGTTHPDLTWIVVAGLVTLALGLLLGIYVDRIRTLFVEESPETVERE